LASFSLGREYEERGKFGSFENGRRDFVAAAQQQCGNNSSSFSNSSSSKRRADCEMQPLAAPPTGFFLHDNTSGERERGRGGGGGCQLALRAGDNFLISSPPIHPHF